MNSHNPFALLFIVVNYLFLTYTNSEFRIINGVHWRIETSPYLVAVNYNGINHCVGSLITMQRVVTAWHCLIDKDVDLFTIIAGVTDIRDLSAAGQSRTVESVYYPCEFSFQTGIMDIALIQVSQIFRESDTVKTISLCDTILPECARMRVSGWGFTTNNGNPSPTLKSTVLRVTSFHQCEKRYRELGRHLTEAMICAEIPGSDICMGDSGAPGVVRGKLCAVTSHNVECNHPYYPSVFTNINDPDVQDFINLVMEN